MGIALEQGKKFSTIRLEGAIDISNASELKAILLSALGAGREVRVALDGVEDLDVTAYQLLWAAERQARGAGVKFSFTGQAPEPVWASLAEAGLERFPVEASAG